MSDFMNLPGNGPTRQELANRAIWHPSPFSAEADATLNAFRLEVDEVTGAIASGNLTPTKGREHLSRKAATMREVMTASAGKFSTIPVNFGELIGRAQKAKAARRNATEDEVARERLRVDRDLLVQLRIGNRYEDIAAAARAADTGRDPQNDMPTVEGLVSFLNASRAQSDDAAAEWAIQKLGSLRRTTADPQLLDKIDDATRHPDVVNDALVNRELAALSRMTPEARAEAAQQILEGGDASALCAAWAMAQRIAVASPGKHEIWMREFLGALHETFPDSAVNAIARNHAETCQTDSQAALAQAANALAQIDSLAALSGIEAPTAAELHAREMGAKHKPGAYFTDGR